MTVSESCSINLTLQADPRDKVKMLESGSIVTSLSECKGKKLSGPSYRLTRQELMRGTFAG